MSTPPTGPFTPRIILHGGAGNITKTSVPRDLYDAYITSMQHILTQIFYRFYADAGLSALDAATHAVTLLEDSPLYNSAHGAVFTRVGHVELECSIMVSNGYRKRGVGCMLLRHVKNPIKLARELLIRGEKDDVGGAQDHQQYSGEYVENLAKEWGCEIVDEQYFWTKRRWDEHLRGLEEEAKKLESGMAKEEVSEWEKNTFLPLGTCGAVVMDSFGTICVATSTGGLTNKVPGRIGDTPTLGAGFWAEEWFEGAKQEMLYQRSKTPIDMLSRGDLRGLVSDCLPITTSPNPSTPPQPTEQGPEPSSKTRHALALSGTGNGDTFLRLCAARTTVAYSRFTRTPFSSAVTWMAGPSGELQNSAGDRWGKTHEGLGGMIGIEVVGDKVEVVWDYNCGGMVRAWTDEEFNTTCLVFRKEGWESGPEGWGDVYGTAVKDRK
ncbi:L-asparaginase precursor [Ophiobolus disseminans]|uniref:L-asparaginase n=1 Tax=Ophiobolus disseminans TaxID=1469910 RepID=A0A6A6ZWR1_9PLEO|nr:L-asparaginase precursor [Ophiobolus disseminans]